MNNTTKMSQQELDKALKDTLNGGAYDVTRLNEALVYVRAGADINMQDVHGITTLAIACELGSIESVEELINLEADVNIPNSAEIYPLTHACWQGRLEITRLLVKSGAQVNHQNANGNTPLMSAILIESHIQVKLLLQHEADTRIKNHKGQTALDIAQANVDDGASSDILEMIKGHISKHENNASSKREDDLSPIFKMVR